MTAPEISMLMTVYNGGAYLAPAVDSVLSSQDVAFELVIVENCSTDGSREYLQSLTDPRIKLILNERNLGQTGALNVGIDACTAPFIARLDADDLTEPDRLAWQAACLRSQPTTALIGGQMELIAADGAPINRTRLPVAPDILAARMLVLNCFDHSSVAFRRDAAIAVGKYPETYKVSQDYALFSALMRAGYDVANTDRVAAKVRTHPDQVMGQALGEREKNETAQTIAENLAWALKRPFDEGLGRTVYRLIMGIAPDGAGAGDVSADAAIRTIFDSPHLSATTKSNLAAFLVGGACDRRLGVRLRLLWLVLRFKPGSIVQPGLWARVVRGLVPARLLSAVRRFN